MKISVRRLIGGVGGMGSRYGYTCSTSDTPSLETTCTVCRHVPPSPLVSLSKLETRCSVCRHVAPSPLVCPCKKINISRSASDRPRSLFAVLQLLRIFIFCWGGASLVTNVTADASCLAIW